MHLWTLVLSYKVDVKKQKICFWDGRNVYSETYSKKLQLGNTFHDLLKEEGIIGLDIIPIKFFRNGEYLGIFIIEESFSKELLEKQNRKAGPIITINNNIDHIFPYNFKIYSENYWLNKKKDFFINQKVILKI